MPAHYPSSPPKTQINSYPTEDYNLLIFFFFQAEDGIRDRNVTGVQTCALPISEGDAFFLVFPRATDAVAAAAAGQRALFAHPWPKGVTVRVRMGLHTGEPQLGGADYIGLDVHRAARISAAAHGGQILLSQTTRDL